MLSKFSFLRITILNKTVPSVVTVSSMAFNWLIDLARLLLGRSICKDDFAKQYIPNVLTPLYTFFTYTKEDIIVHTLQN